MKTFGMKVVSLVLVLAVVASTSFSMGTYIRAAKQNKKVVSVSVTNITGGKLILGKGKKQALKVNVVLAAKSKASKKVTFKSSKPSVVSVSGKGVLYGKKLGVAKITVASKADSKKKVVFTVTVAKQNQTIKEITLNKTSLTITMNDQDLSLDEDASDVEEEDVDESDTGDKEDVLDEGDEEDSEDEEDEAGYQLVASVTPKTATNQTLRWTSSNKSVATVDSDGYVTAHEEGKATITAKATDGSGKKVSCKVTVVDALASDDAMDGDDADSTDDADIVDE